MGLILQSISVPTSKPRELLLFFSSLFDLDIKEASEKKYIEVSGLRLYCHFTAENVASLDVFEFVVDFSIEELSQRIDFFCYRNPFMNVSVEEQTASCLSLSVFGIHRFKFMASDALMKIESAAYMKESQNFLS